MKGIRLWLLNNVLPSPWTVQQGQQNRAPTMQAPFAIMQIVTRQRYATNSRRYDPDGSVTIVKPERMGIQISTFGTGAGNAVSLINTMWRDPDAVAWFRANVPGVAPLHASDPRQHPFTTAEKQYEDQWSVDLIADVLASVTKPGQSALLLGMEAVTQAETLATTNGKS
ncbi:hypothetical protein DTI93_08735 [Parasaccharibacter sp. TMW 2.1884]|uniref:phage neck terminator protein n=1 Tax=Parasaccharibacter sp. TMW 2.1884 TaxID=2267834 RepID=UPI0020115A2E|nr:hypothetical protein [Parasaccharibacter sp. TMW 2.1884]MCL1512469.1 hypothetical protein [Parasaccharibacter sp. TMW 2.1884]